MAISAVVDNNSDNDKSVMAMFVFYSIKIKSEFWKTTYIT